MYVVGILGVGGCREYQLVLIDIIAHKELRRDSIRTIRLVDRNGGLFNFQYCPVFIILNALWSGTSTEFGDKTGCPAMCRCRVGECLIVGIRIDGSTLGMQRDNMPIQVVLAGLSSAYIVGGGGLQTIDLYGVCCNCVVE